MSERESRAESGGPLTGKQLLWVTLSLIPTPAKRLTHRQSQIQSLALDFAISRTFNDDAGGIEDGTRRRRADVRVRLCGV